MKLNNKETILKLYWEILYSLGDDATDLCVEFNSWEVGGYKNTETGAYILSEIESVLAELGGKNDETK
jgi:hypothetical protein